MSTIPTVPPDALTEALARDAVLEPPVVVDDGDRVAAVPVPAPEAKPEDRRRRMLLLLLLGAVIVLLLFGAWYLLNRKPISQLVPEVIAAEPIPTYSYSIYDVVAPTGVAVTADGSRIYAAQSEGGTAVIGFDTSGNKVVTLKPPATSTGDHVFVYVAINPTNGDVYVTDRPAGSVFVYSAAGAYLRTFDPGPGLKGWAPLGLSFDKNGDLFVTSVGAPFEAVHEFGPDGSFIRTFGQQGEFSFPNGVAADANGNVYVADSNNGRVVIFDKDGKELGSIPRGSSEGSLGLPRGLAIDDSGRLFVADVSQQGIQIYHVLAAGETQPKYIGRFGQEGSGDGAFELPNAVAVDGRARQYVADWRNNRIQVWSY